MERRQQEIMDNLIDLVGYDTAFKLSYLYGGSELYVPQGENCLLREQIGAEAFAILQQEYGGTYLWIPQGYRQLIAARNQRIVEQSATCSVRELAKLFSLTQRRIQQILKEIRN